MTIEELTTLEKLNNAFYQCAKVSHWKESTQQYRASLLVRNIQLQDDIRSGSYKASPTIDFTINERGKMRNINAPAVRDRVIQKVLCQEILIPQLSKPLIYDNYASLKNRGTSFARKRLDMMLRKYIRQYGNDGYVLQIDVKKYFESIDHSVLKDMVHSRVKEPDDVMALIDYVIETSSNNGKGLNLGAEAPQIFAVYYLSGIDNYIKTVKGVKFYGRYMDDIIIISNSKEELRQLLYEIEEQLKLIKLEVNKQKTHIMTLRHGFTYMQIKYNIYNGKVIKRPTRKKITRERRRLKKYKKKYDKGEMDLLDIQNAYKSWRNGVLTDCNHGKRSIKNMDNIYKRLFLKKLSCVKTTREKLMQEIFKNKEARQCIRLH